MIPAVNDDLQNDFEVEEQPSRTFRLDAVKNRVIGNVDGLQAIRQAVYLILHTERYEHIIYSWNYGIELHDLFGQPLPYVLPELKRRIKEALTHDERIESVDAFSFETKKGKVHATFTVHTVLGDFQAERTVNI